MYSIEYACLSDRGRVRKINQDNFFCAGQFLPKENNGTDKLIRGTCVPEKPVMFGVFDGMGGEDEGEAAAFISASAAAERTFENGADSLRAFCAEANRRVCRYAEEHELGTVGSTAAVLLFGGQVTVCNLGDSRVYRLREHAGKPEQLSEDQVMPTGGRRKAPLLQFIGIPEDEMVLTPFIREEQVRNGDVYLICSDGLTDMVSEEKIAAILRNRDISSAAEHLRAAALSGGGRDNVTLILAAVRGEGEKEEGAFRRLMKKLFGRK